jgi:hypothetical protein
MRKLGKHGGDHGNQHQPCNTRLPSFGSYGTADHWLARLVRDGRHELAAKVRSGGMSANAAALKAGYRKRRTLTTAHPGNAELIRDVAALYVADGATVADVTYGLGAFWRKTDTARFKLNGTDLVTTSPAVDFRALPYADGSVDVVVLDPPYAHNGASHMVWADRYQSQVTRDLGHDGIIDLYRAGMTEAVRVLKRGGTLWVKCQDEVESGRQKLSHIEIRAIASELQLRVEDLFVVTPGSKPSSKRWQRQVHARKNHSFLWVFRR